MFQLLIVEDEELLRKSMCVMIDWENIGIHVAGAVENGVKALEFLQGQSVDIVMTDIRMPAMDGLELACEIQSRYPEIKTVLCSAYNEFAFARKGIEYGVYGYLLKSQDEEEIEDYFDAMCRRLRKEQAYRVSPGGGEKNALELWKTRELFMRELMRPASVNTDFERLRREADRCRMQLDGYPLIAVQILIDDREFLRDELGQDGVGQLEKALDETLLSEVEWKDRGYLLKLADKRIILWNDVEQGFEERLLELKGVLTDELNAFEAKRQVSVTMALGIPVSSIENLGASFRASADALKCRCYLGCGKMIDGRRVKYEERTASPADSARWLQQAEKCCGRLDPQKLGELLEEIKEEWISRKITDLHAAEAFCMKLMSLLSDGVRRGGGQNSRLLSRCGEGIHSIAKLDSVGGMFDCLSETCQEVLLSGTEETLDTKQPKKLVQKALEFMRKNYASELSLERTAAFVNVHPVHLSRLFRQETGQTFKEILTQLRIDAAKELLNDLDLRIYEISEMVGYQKPRYFSELFKEITGMTPLEYRERQ